MLSKRKWNRIAEESFPVYRFFYYPWQIEERQNFARNFEKNTLILDVGCGFGRDLKVFEDLGLACIGLDFSKEMLKRSVVKNVVNADATNMPFKANMFGGVWCCSTAKHLASSDLSKCFEEAKRVLKPNGLFWIGLDEGTGEKTERKGDMEVTFSRYSNFEETLKDHNFKIVDVQRISAWRNFINFLCKNTK